MPNVILTFPAIMSFALLLGSWGIIFFLGIKFSRTLVHLEITKVEKQELKHKVQELTLSATEYIREIQQQHDKITYLTARGQEIQQIKEHTLESAKFALLELAKDLQNQFISTHRDESFQKQKATEHSINEIVDRFNTQFEKILGIVSSLSTRIDSADIIVDSIKNSLLNPISAGQLAEVTLENILKASGLKEEIDFIMQYHLLSEEQNKLRPDAVVFLPGNRLMIIDAKASKVFLELAEDEQLDNLRRSMSNHLKSLSSKEYDKALGKYYQNRMITTLMFLPTEAAIEKVIQADKEFMSKAWANNILVVGPIGLRNMLNLSKFHIADYDRQKNYEAIFTEITSLVAILSNLIEQAGKLGNNIQSLANNYDKFTIILNRSLLNRLQNLEKLGINLDKKCQPLTRYQITVLN